MSNLYCIVGESGCGKTTIVSMLEKLKGLKSIQSYTTRPKRSENEIGHIFITNEEFDNLKDIVAFTNFNGNRYCSTAEQIENNNLYIIDIEGIKSLKDNYKGDKKIYTIYIKSDMNTRHERMKDRALSNGKTYDEAVDESLARIKNDIFAFQDINYFANFTVTNNEDDLLIDVINKVWDYIRRMDSVYE